MPGERFILILDSYAVYAVTVTSSGQTDCNGHNKEIGAFEKAGAHTELINMGPESMLTCGVNHTASIHNGILTYGAGSGFGYSSTVVKLQTSPLIVFGELNSSTRQ